MGVDGWRVGWRRRQGDQEGSLGREVMDVILGKACEGQGEMGLGVVVAGGFVGRWRR